ncbi:ABC transporter ATP-binding protein [Alkalilimnicola ehrlichii MLHE-1]|uniref:ABC transporter related protein n=1 Tax=Alkalilimnicola ehrlichii (strain ATCC BAA-1101 / DSM 17681 / MLHE-1) TaxID=187272 RepID=Q0A642_ALKEH|nr:ABC transporter ATP-binding protein [Alkalilimnicola ehrlichii]ABI57695.1 ABC transporter related protein [Alkalilimnicola ehrlichii MLHE-1]
MPEILRKTLDLLTAREKRRGALVLAMVVCMALLETAGVLSVVPFLAVLGNPEVVHNQPLLAAAFRWSGLERVQAFLILLALLVFLLQVVAAGFRMLTHFVLNRYIEGRRHSLSQRLLETYLRQPYTFFLNRNSADMTKSILSEVDMFVLTVMRPLLFATAYAIVALAMIALLLFINPLLALAVATIVGGLYALMFLSVRGWLGRIGRERSQANRERFATTSEVLGGIKDIKLLGHEQAYLSRFRPASARFTRHLATSETLAQIPRFAIETVALGGVLILTVVLMATHGDVGAMLPTLGLYVFAGYKLLPAMQHIYAGVSRMRFSGQLVADIHDDLRERPRLAPIDGAPPAPLRPRREIALEGIDFTYPQADTPALQGIDLHIPVGRTVGVVGSSGAGKTTLIDVLLGLLLPQAGHIRVDGTAIDDRQRPAWRRALGYVPQHIFLSDASVAENIALGVPLERIDHAAVVRCARLAHIHEFVSGSLPRGYDTPVGERGVRLSGGQRQRLGIARALYRDPAILVFDEATNALDNETEREVMAALYGLARSKTIIIIAHRLSTVERCDHIVMLEQGRIIDSGTFAELLHNPRFRRLAQARPGEPATG